MRADELTVAWGARSATGNRPENQDCFLAGPPVFVVADGMGGHEHGAAAAGAVTRAFGRYVGGGPLSEPVIRETVTTADLNVRALADHDRRKPGSTLSGVLLTEPDGVATWLVVNLGDSRTYLLSQGRLSQLSVDHSEVQVLLDDGTLTPDQARTWPGRNVITRALGGGLSRPVIPDLRPVTIQSGDRILVCTDGLTREISDQLISAVLLTQPDPQAAADELVAKACEAGGRDNVTVLVVDALGPLDDETAPNALADAPALPTTAPDAAPEVTHA